MNLFGKIKELFSVEYFPLLLIFVMVTRYVPIDSRAGISMFKVGLMCISFIYFFRCFNASKAFIIGFIYLIWIFITAAFINYTTFRSSTVLYLCLFVFTYITFYNLIYSYSNLSINTFINFIKGFIYFLVGLLVIQQIFITIGIKYFPLINLTEILNRGIGANSLCGEPSTFARLLLILYYAYLKCNEYVQSEKVNIAQIFDSEHRWVTIAFLWAMLTMGSGTAFICLGILSLYFMRGWYFLLSIPIFIGVYLSLDYFQVEQFERARSVAIATSSGNAEDVMETDGSAAMRIKPMLNTLNLDLGASESWTGNGCDASLRGGLYGDKRYMAQISDYGLISYILELLLIFTCAIQFRSLATIMFFFGVAGGIGNIPYGWGLIMILTCVKYFQNQYIKGLLHIEDDDEGVEEDDEKNNDKICSELNI